MVVVPEPCQELRRRISEAIYGWDCPVLTFAYPVLIVTHLKTGANTAEIAAVSFLGKPCPLVSKKRESTAKPP